MSRPILKEGHVKFTDGTYSYTMELVDGINGLRETGSQPSTLNIVAGGQKLGDYEPNFSHFEQRTWTGGRGNENYIDDKTRFSSSKNACTWGDKLYPAPRWQLARGLRDENFNLSSSMSWKSLTGATRFVAVRFTAGAC